jgi:hypothetical protein
MRLYIQRNPHPQTLLARVYAEQCPSGYEPSTEEEADAWIAEQLDAGWEPSPDEPTAAPIAPVTPRQFRLALLADGISPAAISGMLANDEAALTEWDYAQEIRRDHPLVESLRLALGKTTAEVDAVFSAASDL